MLLANNSEKFDNLLQKIRQSMQFADFKLRKIRQNQQAVLRNIKAKQKWSNISHKESDTIKKLKGKDFIYLPSDKGSEYCVAQSVRCTKRLPSTTLTTQCPLNLLKTKLTLPEINLKSVIKYVMYNAVSSYPTQTG